METVDHLIIGAGGMGCATAYHLAAQGKRVAVLEARRIASGASGGLGKRGVRGNGRDLRELHFVKEAYGIWPRLAEELDGETGYQRIGGLYLVEKFGQGIDGGEELFHARARTQNNLGIPTELWSRDQVREQLPTVSDDVQLGIYAAHDGMASQEATTQSYAQAAQRLGVEIIEGASVEDLRITSDGRVRSVIASGGDEYGIAETVLLANNYGAVEVLSRVFGIELPAWRSSPLVSSLRSAEPPNIPFLVGHNSRTLSIKIIDGRIMLSGGWSGAWNSLTHRGEVVEEQLQNNIADLQAVFPHLGELEVLEADASRAETITVDHVSVVDRIPSTSNAFVSTGWSGHGWALVPAVAQHLARMLAEKNVPASFGDFSISRFGVH